jgi:hypothetical protein
MAINSAGNWSFVGAGGSNVTATNIFTGEAITGTRAVVEAHLAKKDVVYGVNTTITRPADVTPYTASDVHGGVIKFVGVGNPNELVEVASIDHRYDQAAAIAGTWTLHLYNVTPPSALADNAAFDIPAGDRPGYLGSFALTALADLGSILFMSTVFANRLVKADKYGDLYGYLTMTTGFTPVSAAVSILRLNTKPVVLS